MCTARSTKSALARQIIKLPDGGYSCEGLRPLSNLLLSPSQLTGTSIRYHCSSDMSSDLQAALASLQLNNYVAGMVTHVWFTN